MFSFRLVTFNGSLCLGGQGLILVLLVGWSGATLGLDGARAVFCQSCVSTKVKSAFPVWSSEVSVGGLGLQLDQMSVSSPLLGLLLHWCVL